MIESARMADMVLTPYLTVHDGAAAIDFYSRAFGAEETGHRFADEDGRIGHAELAIGGAMDWRIDLSEKKLVPNPRSPDEPLLPLAGASSDRSLA